jgi:hypothetical protein
MSALHRITAWTKPASGLVPGLLLLAGAAGCGAGLPEEWLKLTEQGKRTTIESHTDFQTFEYTRTAGMWLDAGPGALAHATITREPDGSYWLDEVREGEGTGGADSRITWDELLGDGEWDAMGDGAYDAWISDLSWPNVSEQDLPPRQLTAGQVQRMLSIFAAIPVDYEYVESDIDYYYFEDVRWDERSLSANPSYGYCETIAYDKIEEIVQMLEDFRSASTAW